MPEAKYPVAILNPKAAGGRTLKVWPGIAALLQKRFGGVQERFTSHPQHATELARSAIEAGHNLVIAVGGDGTINEVANGFLRDDKPVRPEAVLGIIPIGTGGDFRRTLQLPSEIDKAVEVIAAGRTMTIDVGRVRLNGYDGVPVERYFVNVVSLGMGGDVSKRAQNFLSPLGGGVAFLYATLEVFLTYRAKHVRLQLDDTPLDEKFWITNIAIGNGRYHGGGMHPCPTAVLDDGQFEVTTIDRLNMFELVRDLPVLYSDDIYQHAKVRHFRASKVVAQSAETTRIEVDGEALGTLPLEVQLLPRVLPVIVPADIPRATG